MADTLYPNAISVTAAPQTPVTAPVAVAQTDFSEYTTSAQPSDWTERWNPTVASSTVAANGGIGAIGNKYLYQSHSSLDYYLLSWDVLDGAEDIELLARVRWSQSAIISANFLIARASGGSSENGYAVTPRDNDNILRIVKYVSGSQSTVASSGTISLSENTWYWLRFRVQGTSLKAKIWPDTSEEPGTWSVEGTDSSITDGGWAGIGSYWSYNYIFDYVSATTDGSTAPSPPDYLTQDAALSIAASVPNPTVYVSVGPGAVEATGTVNAPQLHFTIKPATVQASATPNSPTFPGVYPDALPVSAELPAPTMALYINPDTLEQTVSLPAPTMGRYVKPTQAQASVSFDAPWVFLPSAVPATVDVSVTLPAPAIHLAIKPESIDVSAAQPAPGIQIFVGPESVAASVTANVPAVGISIKPDSITIWQPMPPQAVAAASTLQPECISQAVQAQSPGLNVEINASRLEVSATVPAPLIYTDKVPNCIQVYAQPQRHTVICLHGTQTLQPDSITIWHPMPTHAVVPWSTTDKVPNCIQVYAQPQRPTVICLHGTQTLQPDSITIWQPIPPQAVAAQSDLQPETIEQPVVPQTPELTSISTVRPGTVLSTATPYAPSTYTDIVPATVTGTTELLPPQVSSTAKPAALDVTATVPAPTLGLILQPQQVSVTATTETPTLRMYLTPETIDVSATVPTQRAYIPISPEIVEAIAQIPAPSIALTIKPAVLSVAAIFPVQNVAQDRVIEPATVVTTGTLPQPSMYKHLEILYPQTVQATASMPAPTISLFHTFTSVRVKGGFAANYHVFSEFIDRIFVPE